MSGRVSVLECDVPDEGEKEGKANIGVNEKVLVSVPGITGGPFFNQILC